MSSGDAKRREVRIIERRAEQRREHDENLLFVPQLSGPISPSHVKSESRLKLREDPDSYIGRVAQAEERKQLDREKAIQKREEQELSECTFSPQIQKGAPGFVQQMAETYRSARSFQQSEAEAKSPSPRPEWRSWNGS